MRLWRSQNSSSYVWFFPPMLWVSGIELKQLEPGAIFLTQRRHIFISVQATAASCGVNKEHSHKI